ncbi:uncharacterized protein EV420DRAFT_1747162 [Desarmillaria tabescens]|uniref:Mid2 domain-containing protein n=1 Tax=Armillaria tabescens TaxID=1929756 RepID=A0AA39KHT2_ARMTA|nr:uncharacterized protein EV420DRAFT_1747162 [Desarmillaria tabescens]KAK0460241.1 hypothetical protein EV420DRAFT_1747162 [Desarmillaria tabescens]
MQRRLSTSSGRRCQFFSVFLVYPINISTMNLSSLSVVNLESLAESVAARESSIISTPTLSTTSTLSAISKPTLTPTKSDGDEVGTVTATKTTVSSPVVSSGSTDSSSKATPLAAVIAGSVIGSLASVVVLALLFVLWRRIKGRNRVGNNTKTIEPFFSPRIRSSSLFTRPISVSTIESLTSGSPPSAPRRLSQSSRNAYEEEIEQLRQQIRDMDEQMEIMHNGSSPPSYHSRRRSEVSDPFASPSPP